MSQDTAGKKLKEYEIEQLLKESDEDSDDDEEFQELYKSKGVYSAQSKTSTIPSYTKPKNESNNLASSGLN